SLESAVGRAHQLWCEVHRHKPGRLDTDASNPSSRLMLTILAGVAEFEREIIRERTLAGVRAARAAGKHCGRPRLVFRREKAMDRGAAGMSFRAIARELGVSVATVHSACSAFEKSTPPAAESAKQDRAISTAAYVFANESLFERN